LLIVDSVYRPLRNFADGMMQKFGVEVSYYDPLIGADIVQHFRPNTRAVWTEAPGSHTMEMQDIPAICAAAHAHGAVVLMDNTWATGIFFDAHAAGVDYSVQAGTKYFAGHSDVLIGSVSARTPEQYKIIRDSWHLIGSIIAPEDAFLTLRGLRTIHLRLPEHQKSALTMAQWFAQRPEVARVMYPPLPSDPGHALWKRDFTGASGLMSIELKPVSRTALAAFVDHLALFGMGASWGGYESLVLPFECSPYRTATKPNFAGPTVRFHIGLEDVADLQADLDQGFARMKKAG
ncbi:MAG: cystathionine beta-lyase, partial [Beijerinckiaceae bacterium]